MAIRVVILGTGTIIPSRERRATSLLVEAGGESMLFDCGPGAVESVEHSGRTYRDIGKIFITHFHPDHTLDLGRLFSAIKNDESYPDDGRVEIFGPPGLDEFIECLAALYPGIVPSDDRVSIRASFRSAASQNGACEIRACPVDHAGRPAYAYRVSDRSSSVTFTGDSDYCPSVVELARGTDLLVAECSFPDDHPVMGHLTPSSVGRIAREAGVGRVALVHLYPLVDEGAAVEGVGRMYDGPVDVARDGMEIDV